MKKIYKIKRYKLKEGVKEIIVKLALTSFVGIIDIVLCHYLLFICSYTGFNSWSSVFILVGWFWLLAGQFMGLYALWQRY